MGVDDGDFEAALRDAEGTAEALDPLFDVHERGAVPPRHVRRVGDHPFTRVTRDVRPRLMHLAGGECQCRPKEGIAGDVVGEDVRRLAAAADDAGVLGAAAVDERRLHDALGVEAGEIEQRAVDTVQRAAAGDDLRVPLAAGAVEVPEGRVVGRDQHGRARLGDAVAQPCGGGARLALEGSILLELRLFALLQDHDAEPERHERDRDDQKHEPQ